MGAGPGSGSRPGPRSAVARAFLGLIRGYQIVGSPVLGGACRFYPSCSEYALTVIERDGPWRGGVRAIGRLARCTPLQRGGLDLP